MTARLDFHSTALMVLCCFLAGAGHCANRTTAKIDLKEVAHYSLAMAQKTYGPPLTGLVPFEVSPDGKRLAAEIRIKDAEGCGHIAGCGADVLGIFDLSSGQLIAQTVGRRSYEPAFALLRQGGTEVVSNFGPSVVILDADNLSVKDTLQAENSGDQPPLSIASAAMSADGNFLAVLYFRPRPNRNPRAQTVGQITFRLYRLDSPAAISNCILANDAAFPTFRVALSPSAETFLAGLIRAGTRGVGEYDSRTCGLKRSWEFADVPTRAEFSSDANNIAFVFGGTYPKLKLAVFSHGGEKPVWTLPAHSLNDMEWPVSISPDGRFLAISTDRYGESWLDAFREASHIDRPGVEIRSLSDGRRIAKAIFMRRTRSSTAFGPTTALVQFLSPAVIAVVTPRLNVRLYQLSRNQK